MLFSRQLSCVASILFALTTTVSGAYDLDPSNKANVVATAKTLAADMLTFYNTKRPGLLPEPYYWWEAGAMMDALIHYWVYTGDDQYNDLITTALLAQTGSNNDYMPIEQTRTEGNDDQGFWAFAVMSAAEFNFPNPPSNKPQWLALAQAVFNVQAQRWDKNCGGGLRWQIVPFNNGFDYKNSISQACFFALGARLAVYTGNSSYADWAEKTWDWMQSVKLISDVGYVYDGINADACSNITILQFTYNAASMALGAGAMYNFTNGDAKWGSRLDLLLKGADVFMKDDVMVEVACEEVDRCNPDQNSFKAYMSRWFADITKWAPYTYNTVMPWIKATAIAGTKDCVGGANGRMCGLKWHSGKYDGTTGPGQQMGVLEATLGTIVADRRAPYTANNGGTSKGDAGAGSGNTDSFGVPLVYHKLSSGNFAGGAFLTLAVLLAWMYAVAWLLKDERSSNNMFQQAKNSLTKGRGMGAALGATSVAAAGGVVMRAGAGRRGKGVQENASSGGSVSDRNSRISDRDLMEMPIRIGHVRNTSDTSIRRQSNMPLGWPRTSMINSGSNSDAGSARGAFVGVAQSDEREALGGHSPIHH